MVPARGSYVTARLPLNVRLQGRVRGEVVGVPNQVLLELCREHLYEIVLLLLLLLTLVSTSICVVFEV